MLEELKINKKDLKIFLGLLSENGAEGPKKISSFKQNHNPETISQRLNNLSREYTFPIPDYCAYLFYNIGTFFGDFDVAYFYPPNLAEYFFIDNPRLDNLVTFSKKSTKLIKIPLLAIYETNRFAIPKLQLYEQGILIQESKLAGNEPYDPDYWKKDYERSLKNFKSISEWINKIIKND